MSFVSLTPSTNEQRGPASGSSSVSSASAILIYTGSSVFLQKETRDAANLAKDPRNSSSVEASMDYSPAPP